MSAGTHCVQKGPGVPRQQSAAPWRGAEDSSLPAWPVRGAFSYLPYNVSFSFSTRGEESRFQNSASRSPSAEQLLPSGKAWAAMSSWACTRTHTHTLSLSHTHTHKCALRAAVNFHSPFPAARLSRVPGAVLPRLWVAPCLAVRCSHRPPRFPLPRSRLSHGLAPPFASLHVRGSRVKRKNTDGAPLRDPPRVKGRDATNFTSLL